MKPYENGVKCSSFAQENPENKHLRLVGQDHVGLWPGKMIVSASGLCRSLPSNTPVIPVHVLEGASLSPLINVYSRALAYAQTRSPRFLSSPR